MFAYTGLKPEQMDKLAKEVRTLRVTVSYLRGYIQQPCTLTDA